MTDQLRDTTNEAVIYEALSVIDGALARMMRRELVSSGEVADLLLDVRTLLTAEPVALIEVPEPVASETVLTVRSRADVRVSRRSPGSP